jgi:hypothetical protein
VKRTRWTFILTIPAIAALAASACSNTIEEPPQLGDCLPTGDASCRLSGVPSGSPGAIHGDGGATPGLDGDGGSCGAAAADQMVSSNTQNPGCIPCIVGASEAGACDFCASDSACSNDPGCLAILQCALMMCHGDAACVGITCEGLSTSQSVQNYNAFGGCLGQTCPQCPQLPQGTTSDI